MLGVQGDNTARGEPFPINITLNYPLPLKQPEAKGAGPDPPRRLIRSDLSQRGSVKLREGSRHRRPAS